MNNDDQLLEESRNAYMQETRDMLRQFEQSLLALEQQPDDRETLNAAFRAAHTIKGSSGLFGYHAIVQFTHGVEAVLDAMRDGTVQPSETAIALLLRAGDQIEAMVDDVASGASEIGAADRQLSSQIGALMDRSPEHGGPPRDADVAAAAQGAPPAHAAVGEPGGGIWHISLRFGPDTLRDGFDPMSFLRYLPRIGEVHAIAALLDNVPALEQLDPEACYLGFEVRLETQVERTAIEEVFEFAMEDCKLHLIAPGAGSDEYLRILQLDAQAGFDEERLGEGLLAVAAVSAGELRNLKDRLHERAPHAAASAPPAPPPAAEAIEIKAAAAAERRRGALDRRRGDDARYIRVSADKLDQLIDLIGELVIAASGAQLVAGHSGTSEFAEAAQRIGSLVESARDGALQLRMVQIGETFNRFHRVVRDNAKSLGKEIELVITGGDTELDKSMVEMIADPLMHLVRNGIDHGLETPLERDAAGKPARGKLALHAYHDSGAIVIEVSDDGRGLNRPRILAKAIERGLVPAGTALTDDQIDQLIFAPGFSTAAAVTDISGRGVGMDVVKRNIEALRGSVHLASTPGRGTTTQIRLPLTLAIIDGFLVRVGNTNYIVPLEAVVECIELPASRHVGRDERAGYVDLRGEVFPYLDLRRHLRASGEPDGDRRSIVMVRHGGSRVGLVVDRLLGEYQTVIKPLSRIFASLRGVAGSTILGSGEVALILDVPALVATATDATRSARAGAVTL